jgi:hypothetical protein
MAVRKAAWAASTETTIPSRSGEQPEAIFLNLSGMHGHPDQPPGSTPVLDDERKTRVG